ncbi:hypothetical protein HK099_005458 [Clydaea vesicula]|uniref:DUF3668 domain-containing protein n=1 Tax=Clydaea vesicula TaxID=447962 RepID=A0AAD5U121_9FUNG|nr:hypothetical protein HK099_005458 [Clydaea vesicula]
MQKRSLLYSKTLSKIVLSIPLFDTELAWELDTKALGFLRSQRASLKMVLYSILPNNRRDTLGYIMLDLRGASQSTPATEKWYPLINSKQGGAFRPEIKISFSVTPSSQLMETTKEIPLKKQPKLNSSTQKQILLPTNFNVKVSNNNNNNINNQIKFEKIGENFYTIFNNASEKHFDKNFKIWELNITVAFAESLRLLLDTYRPNLSRSSEDGFHFLINFLESDFTTEKFYDLDNPIFNADGYCIKFKSSKENLISFFNQSSSFVLYLCHKNQVVGLTHVQLTTLINNFQEKSASIVEKVYNFFDANEQLPISHDSKVPNIGLSLKLELFNEEDNDKNQTYENKNLNFSPTRSEKSFASEQNQESPKNSLQNNFVKTLPKKKNFLENPKENFKVKPTENDNNTFINQKPQQEIKIQKKKIFNFNDKKVWRQYRFSIDFLCLTNFNLEEDCEIFMKYSYQPFGTNSFIKTSTISVLKEQKNEAIFLPHCFSAFEFIMSFERLKTYLDGVPLVIEVWKKGYGASSDVLLGTTTIDLSEVLNSPKEITRSEDIGEFLMQTCENKIGTVIGSEEYSYKKITDLKMNLSLEDFGEALTTREEENEEGEVDYNYETKFNDSEEKKAQYLSENMMEEIPSLKENLEYKTSLELEKFKKKEEEKFKLMMLEKERLLMQKFSEEFKKREKEREAILKKKIEEFRTLEQQLHNLLFELEVDQARRLHEEYTHQMELEKKKCKEYEIQNLKILKEKENVEKELKSLEKEFVQFKLNLNQTPESILNSDLLKMKEEKYGSYKNDDFFSSFDMDENIDPKVMEEIDRLIRERDGLLSTGVYSKNDLIIVELEKRVKSLINSN